MEKGRVIGVCFGFLLAIPAVFIRLIVRFINLGCGVFRVKTRTQPACLLDPELGVHKYMSVNGTKIHYVEAGDSDKPLMLFVHGFPEFWFSWRHQIKHFKKNYRVVAMDTRGYNESDKPAGIEEYILGFNRMLAPKWFGSFQIIGEIRDVCRSRRDLNEGVAKRSGGRG